MSSTVKRNDASETVGAGVPARRLEGRRVVVVLGASASGLSLLSRTLHALGVDMLEGDAADVWSGSGAEWRRPWVADFHRRLLDAIDRPPGHLAHPLPFPPGWWRRPAVQAIRREMTHALEAALSDHAEPWGFADLVTARLLPVWSEVFERLGLQPEYIWGLTHPVKSEAGVGRRGRRGRRGTSAEILWFAYSADVYRYAGQRLSAVVEESAWRDDPQALIDKLLGRLHLHWRGTRLDLFETLTALLEREDHDVAVERAATLPICLALYEAAARIDEDDDARERLASLVEGAELLRPMISPIIAKLGDGSGSPPAPDESKLKQERDELRATCADLRRQLNGAAVHLPPVEPDADAQTRLADLELELESRAAETRWLHEQYRERFAEMEAEASALRARMGSTDLAGAAPHATEDELAAAHAEIQRLSSEMRNLNNANERYLARIYELKKALEERGGF